MGFFSWIIFGALAGWIASMIMGKNASMGAIANIVVGIVGSFIGGFIGSRLFNVAVTGFNVKSLIVAIVGSVILLAIINKVQAK